MYITRAAGGFFPGGIEKAKIVSGRGVGCRSGKPVTPRLRPGPEGTP